MSADLAHGLSCPRCGGMVPVPEGQAIVACPYCEQRSLVVAGRLPQPRSPVGGPPPGELAAVAGSPPAPGETEMVSEAPLPGETVVVDGSPEPEGQGGLGVRRYQAPLRVTAQAAETAFRAFLGGKFQVARDCAKTAALSETFLVHLPFWAVWGRGVAWAFGQERVGSGKDSRYEPREKKVIRELDYNCPACEVGEFGVRQISLKGCPLEPFDPGQLHRSGMVFEPVGSSQAILEAARTAFMQEVRDAINLDRTEQVIARLTRPRLGLVYYPLWVMRYLYRGRAFQVVVDGVSGQVLYGKAPGSVGYRAGVLVGGMAAGAVVSVDVPVLLLLSSSNSDEESPLMIAGLALLAGLGMMYGAYRVFRHGEHYEYHRFGRPKGSVVPGSGLPALPGKLKEVEMLARSLEKFT